MADRIKQRIPHLLFIAILALAAGATSAQENIPPTERIRWDDGLLRQKPGWYSSVAARAVADSVIQYQSRQGGWPKSTDLATPPRSPADMPPSGQGLANSLDNGATTTPMEFLALVTHATHEARYRESFARGLDYLFAAQYPNGGWPQFYPLREGYYSRITYNDGAMMRVMSVLRDVAAGAAPYDFVEEDSRAKAAAAVERGLDCILRTQIKQDDKLAVWCAQHDEQTLAPAWTRNYEVPSLSDSESVGIVRFLMEIEKPTPQIIAAVEGAVAWFKSASISGVRVERFTNADGQRDWRAVADPSAAPVWARFYELGTSRPIFVGRDQVVRYTFAEIERERRSGYSYYGDWPRSLLVRDYPKWRTKHKLP
ncbi:MAG: pectate lyase [Verrucomicrobia bacterium]|nr:pectate lyase [Verrucomicrobiota bacterium]